jgi:hypothetical protein
MTAALPFRLSGVPPLRRPPFPPLTVFPAKAGIHRGIARAADKWIPAFAGKAVRVAGMRMIGKAVRVAGMRMIGKAVGVAGTRNDREGGRGGGDAE